MTNGILLLTQMVSASRVRTPGTLPLSACTGSFTTGLSSCLYGQLSYMYAGSLLGLSPHNCGIKKEKKKKKQNRAIKNEG